MMPDWLKRLFIAPTFEDEEKTRVARLLNVILWTTLAIIASFAVYYPIEQTGQVLLTNMIALAVLAVIVVLDIFLMHRGAVRLASLVFSLALWSVTFVFVFFTGGLRSADYDIVVLSLVIVGLLLGGRAAITLSVLSVLADVVLLVIDWAGMLPAHDFYSVSLFEAWLNRSTDLVLVALLLYLTDRAVKQSLARARRDEQALLEANRELEASHEALRGRTQDLERRTAYLEASAEVQRIIASILQPEILIEEVVNLIKDRFALYFVGVFLVDASGEWAVLAAGTGRAGQSVRVAGLRLPVDQHSTIGWSVVHAQACTCDEDSEDLACLILPDLPNTRAEAALPLHSRGQVLGAISVHSDVPRAFDDVLLAVLQTMADQVAVALDNARLFTASQESLEAERRAYGQMERDAWARLLEAGMTPGYHYTGKQVMPIRDLWRAEMVTVLHDGEQVVLSAEEAPDEGGAVFAAPLKVRGETIAVIDLRKGDGAGDWLPEELALLETLTDQLEVALESARLYRETQQRAARDRLVSEVTSQIRATLDVDVMLKTAVRELRESLGLSEAEVRMGVLSSPIEEDEQDSLNRVVPH